MVNMYILKHRKPLVLNNATEWARTIGDFKTRRIRQYRTDGLLLSTVFLGIDMGLDGDELFETMLFFGDDVLYCQRCGTHREAIKIHLIAKRYFFTKGGKFKGQNIGK